MKKRVLIIGGGGFIGINLAKFLIKNRDYELTLADQFFFRDLNEYFTDEETKKIQFITGDFSSTTSFDKLGNNFDFVYMLASVVGVNNTLENPAEVLRVNTSIIMNCLEWLKNSSVEKVLFSSTSEAYSGTTDVFQYGVPTDETVPLTIKDVKDPRFTYAITKILGESAFFAFAKKYGFQTTVLRYHNAFGPDMGFKHVIPHLVERFTKNENPFKMYGFDQTRSFSFISDTIDATVLAMESKKANGEIFHIGNPDEITIEELIRTVGELMGYDGIYIEAPTFPSSVARRCPDISKAKALLNYEPKVNWRTGLIETVEWYKSYFLTNHEASQDGFKKE